MSKGRSCPKKFCICIFSPCILIFHAIRIYLCGCMGMCCSMVWQHISRCCCACWACLCCACCGCSPQFIDKEFPPNQQSLGGPEQMGVEWVRLDEVLAEAEDNEPIEVVVGGSGKSKKGKKKKKEEKRIQLFEGGIQAADVDQGSLGDCWLMAAIAALAEYPAVIQSIFVTKRYSTYGKYTLRLYDPAKQDYYETDVDNFVPCKRHRGKAEPIYAGAANEMWVVLLEKAAAKYFGSYAQLKGGRTEWAMNFLTGYPTFVLRATDRGGKGTWDNEWQRYNMKVKKDGTASRNVSSWTRTDEKFSVEDIFYILREYDEKDAIICTESYGNDDTQKNENGIVLGHAYTVISVKKVDDRMFLNVRNPWGTGEWTGDWGDDSKMWDLHPSVKKELDFKPRDDGAFWIEMKDFIKNFDAVTICVRETGFTDLALDPHEHLGCCGVAVGCICGCASYWCCCKGCKALCCGEEADDETVKGERDGCCPCCPRL